MIEKKFDTVKFFRMIKEKLGIERFQCNIKTRVLIDLIALLVVG